MSYPARHRDPTPCACGCGGTFIKLRASAKYIAGHGHKYCGGYKHRDRKPIGATRVITGPTGNKYRMLKVAPGAKGWKLEHRVIMERHVGRPLLPDEDVHHINHKTLDNRLENLQLLTQAEHLRLHDKERKRDEKGRLLPTS